MKKSIMCFAVMAAVVSALAQAVAPAIENEEQAYGAVYGRIAERIRLWPGLAPHETKAEPGRFVKGEKHNTWRRVDVSCPELVILRPEGTPRDTLVLVMPGGGYSVQSMGCCAKTAKNSFLSARNASACSIVTMPRQSSPKPKMPLPEGQEEAS